MRSITKKLPSVSRTHTRMPLLNVSRRKMARLSIQRQSLSSTKHLSIKLKSNVFSSRTNTIKPRNTKIGREQFDVTTDRSLVTVPNSVATSSVVQNAVFMAITVKFVLKLKPNVQIVMAVTSAIILAALYTEDFC